MRAHGLQKASSGALRYVLKTAVPKVPEHTVVLPVFGRLEGFHTIVHMGVCGEYVLQTVVIEIDQSDAPAAVDSAECGDVSVVAGVGKQSTSAVPKERE